MTTAGIVSIVPRLPPQHCGVGDYAVELARELRDSQGVHTTFLVCGYDAKRAGPLDDFVIHHVEPHSHGEITRFLRDEKTVLFHYSNYGYHRYGCPVRLVGAVKAAVSRGRSTRLLTMFHEMYSVGPPWSLAFWLSPVHRTLARTIASLSESGVTNTPVHEARLRRWRSWHSLYRLPVLSGIGEPTDAGEPSARVRRIVVFGGSATRAVTYQRFASRLVTACIGLGIEEIVDVGPGLEDLPSEFAGIPVRRAGALPSAEVSAMLSGALAGFLSYPVPLLHKSTVFAAYAAHGLLPVVCDASATPQAAALESAIYWSPEECRRSAGGEPGLARSASEWYRAHSRARQGAVFAALLRGERPDVLSRVDRGGPEMLSLATSVT